MLNSKYKMELAEISKLKEKIARNMKQLPEGKVWSELNKKRVPQYYLITEATRKQFPRGRFLRKDEINIARDYIQNEYQICFMEKLEEREEVLKAMLKEEYAQFQHVYDSFPKAKRALIEPYILSDEEFIKKWKESFKLNENSYPIDTCLHSEAGELVRSKSEKMIADKLYMKNIPYVYEPKIILPNKKTAFPDFAMLNVRTRATFYMEHFGMMDDPEYCKQAIEKITMYEKNGIHIGENLLVIFESQLSTIDMEYVDSIIRQNLL